MSSETSLSRQLAKLRVPQTSVHKETYGSVSFIYDFVQAKTIDINAHYSNAIASLENLIQIDGNLKSFKQTLFHESSKKFDRGQKTRKENEELDHLIEELLFRVSKYFQLTDTHKVLEYMIQKYKIHQYNVDALIGSVLPFHETRIFVRLIQTCSEVKNPHNQRFYWMKKFQENGVPLSKSVLLNHCISDPEFARYVTDSSFKALQIDADNSIFPSFITSFCLNLIQRTTNDVVLAFILSVISKCLSMQNPQLYTTSYMIFSHLSNLVRLEAKIVDKLLKSLIRHPENINEYTLIAFEIIIKSQGLSSLPSKFIRDEFLNKLYQNSGKYKLESMSKAIIITILCQAGESELDPEAYKFHLCKLLEISGSEMTIKSIVEWINNQDVGNDKIKEMNRFVMEHIEKMFPTCLELAISALDPVKNIGHYLKSVRHSVVDESRLPLYVAVKHSNERVRKQSIQYLARNFSNLINNAKSDDLMFIKHIILDDLNENFAPTKRVDILLKMLDVRRSIFNLFTVEEFEKFASSHVRWINQMIADEIDSDSSGKMLHLKRLLIEIYCSNSYQDYPNSKPEIDKHFLEILFQDSMQQILLIELVSMDIDSSSLILESNYAKTSPLFGMIRKHYRNADNSQKPEVRVQSFFHGFSEFLNTNRLELFHRANLWNSIRSTSNMNFRFNLLFLYCLIKMMKQHPVDLSETTAQIACQFAMDQFLTMLASKCKISSQSEIKITECSDYREIDMDEYFVREFSDFNSQRISLLVAGYLLFVLVEQKSSSDDLPSTADWFLSNVGQLVNYDFYYKIYCLLIHYSTPNEAKPFGKKVYRFFRHLFSVFVGHRILHHSAGFRFFLPSIVDQDSSIQIQTLVILDNLLTNPMASGILVESLKSHKQYLISYLLALSSPTVAARQTALLNIEKISDKLGDQEEELKCFLQTIIEEEQVILTDEQRILVVFGRLHSANKTEKSNILNELFSTIIFILTANQSCVTSKNKVALLKLLRCCNLEIKSIIFEYYYDQLFSSAQDRMISADEESQIIEVISYFNEIVFNDLPKTIKLKKDNTCLKFFLKCIEKSGMILTEKASIATLELLTPERFRLIQELHPDYALKIVETLLRTQLTLTEIKPSPTINHAKLVECLHKKLKIVTFNSDFIQRLMDSLLPIDEIYDAFTEVPKEKRFKTEDSNRRKRDYCTKWKLFRIYVSILSTAENFDCSGSLVKILFDYLKLTFMEVDDNASHLTRQTLLYAIFNCIELKFSKKSNTLAEIKSQTIEASGSGSTKMDVDQADPENLTEFIDNINVDTIIDCMHESRVKETQRISLLLISLIAPYFRKQIVEYLVTIFTFIGSNLLECDDQYSLAILFETMESIIPIVIDNKPDQKRPEESPKTESSDLKHYIISVFIKSFADIPAYRRLPLFTKLIELLGSEYFLPIITVRLIEQLSSSSSSNKSDNEQETSVSFLNKLFDQFPVQIQLKSICMLLRLFEKKFLDNHFRISLQKKLQSSKHSNSSMFQTELIQNDGAQFDSLIELSKSLCKDFKSKLNYDEQKLICGLSLLRFVSQRISTEQFVSGVRQSDRIDANISISLVYLINIIFELIVLLSPSGGLRSTLNVYRKRIKLALDDILLKYNALLTNDKLLDIVLLDLLNNTAQLDPSVSILIQRKALELLNEKLTKLHQNAMDAKTVQKIIDKLFQRSTIYNENIKQLDEHQIHNVQLILLSLKTLTKFIDIDKMDSQDTIALLIQALNAIIRLIKSINESSAEQTMQKSMQNLKTSSILCSTQILSTLSLEGIPFLSDVINLILDNFDAKDDIVIISNVSALYKVVMNFAKFLSPHLKSIIRAVLPIYSLCDHVADLRSKLYKLWQAIAKSVQKRIIFEAIEFVYEKAVSETPKLIVELMNLFRLSCDNIERTDVEIILKNLKNFMLKALNFRALNHSNVDLAIVESIETSFCQAFAAFIPKLTESNFRPIYYSLLEWAIRIDKFKIDDPQQSSYSLPEECYHRMISFYRFCCFLADRLKSLFCVFVAPTIIQNCNQILLAYHSSESTMGAQPEQIVDENTKEAASLRITDPEIGEPLVQAILSTIAKCFLYDLNGAFVNKDCISLIVKPVVNQISNFYGSDEQYEARLDLILQCTQYLIQNNKDETLIKDFNYQILLKTRDTNEKVKVSAIKMLHRLILTCNEDYLPFIPEAMPFIAELSEDDSDTVEYHLKKMITDIEQLIGEPISKYL